MQVQQDIPFDINEARHVEQCLLIMEDSKKLASQKIENDYFKEAMKFWSKSKKTKKDEDDEDDD